MEESSPPEGGGASARINPYTGAPGYDPWPIQERVDEVVVPLITDPELMNHCGVRTAQALVLGLPAGLMFGMFIGLLGPGNLTQQALLEKLPMRQQMYMHVRIMLKSSWRMAKMMSLLGALFAGSECAIEKYRGRVDLWNSLTAGCLSGGYLAVRGGPQAMAAGCAGMALFSLVIDSVFHH